MEGDGGDGGAGHKCRHPHLPVHQVSGNDRCHGSHMQTVGHYSRRNANKQIGSEVSATTTELRWKFLNMNIGRWDDLIVFFHQEIVVVSLNGYIHCWNALRMKQVQLSFLSSRKTNMTFV